MSDDFRHRPRRRGPQLADALHGAALDELTEHGFSGFSLERVAARAGTGKSVIYRRWPTKADLIVDTLAQAFPDPEPAVTSGDLRTDLLSFHRHMAAALRGPVGAALLANAGQHGRHPELGAALRERIIAPRERLLRELLAAAVQRGEARADALAPECVSAGPALLRQKFIESGGPVSDQDVARLVDQVLLPMLRSGGPGDVSAQ